jgi:hypothetical protein
VCNARAMYTFASKDFASNIFGLVMQGGYKRHKPCAICTESRCMCVCVYVSIRVCLCVCVKQGC